jgi:hypothetical protein
MNIIKITLAIIFLLCSFSFAQAQSKWSAGYRTGLELVNFQMTTEDFTSENYIWHNQLFLARQLGNKFAMEATLSHTSKNYFGTSTSSLPEVDSFVNDVTQTKLALSIAGKYPILAKLKWSLYGQLGFTFVRTSNQYSNSSYKQGVANGHKNETENFITLFDRTFGGLGLDYNLSKRLYLTSTLNVYYKIDGITYPGNAYYNNWTANFLVGAGLKIWHSYPQNSYGKFRFS